MGYTQGTFGPAPVTKFSEGFIQEALEKYFAENSVRYFMDNLFVFRWESDKLIETKTGYREKCKHLSEYEDICYLRSHHGPNGGITMGCVASANCPRMKRYDKLHK